MRLARRYSEFIDHIALDKSACALVMAASFAEFTYGLAEDKHPSDHCTVSINVATGGQVLRAD